MAVTKKIRMATVQIDKLGTLDWSRNIRDPQRDHTMEIADLAKDLLATADAHPELPQGMKVHPMYHFRNNQFERVIQGYLRTSAVMLNHKLYPNDRRWDSIYVEVFEDLSEPEIMALMLDNGNLTPLKSYEVIRSIWMTLDADPNISEGALTLRVQGYLRQFWPCRADVTSDDRIREWYRGTIQNIRYLWRLPDIAKDELFKLLKKGKPVSYRRKDVRELVSVFETEMRSDLTHKITKANPGPAFVEKFEAFMDAEAEAEGTDKKPKALGAMSKKEMDGFFTTSDSVIVKDLLSLATRTLPDSDQKIVMYGKLLRKVESGELSAASDEFARMRLAVMEGKFVEAGLVPVDPNNASVNASTTTSPAA